MTYKTCLALLLFSSGIVLSTTSCKHNPMIPVDDDIIIDDTTDVPDDTTGMGTPCDPEKVYFELQILPLLRSNCAKSGCHDEATHEEGIVLTSYEKVMTTGEVTPYDLGDSEIYEKMTETDPDKRMPPPPNNPLSSDQINLIAKWILQGAQNLTCDPDAGNCITDNISFSATVNPLSTIVAAAVTAAPRLRGVYRLPIITEYKLLLQTADYTALCRTSPAM